MVDCTTMLIDNNLSYADQDYNTLMNFFLEKESSILIEWFKY